MITVFPCSLQRLTMAHQSLTMATAKRGSFLRDSMQDLQLMALAAQECDTWHQSAGWIISWLDVYHFLFQESG